jgi:hypothetical protein
LFESHKIFSARTCPEGTGQAPLYEYVKYPHFQKDWWAYRQTYHGHVRDELVCRSLKEKGLASSVRILVNDIEDLKEVWEHTGHLL